MADITEAAVTCRMEQDTGKLTIENLIKAPLPTFSDDDAMACAGSLIDLSSDERSEPGINRAFGMLRELEKRALPPEQQAMLHYFRANAWHARAVIEGIPGSVRWENTAKQEQILELLRARNHPGFAKLHDVRRCQILTNLGSQLSRVGRIVEAIEVWDSALEILPNFAMALGCRGGGLRSYGTVSEDSHDRALLLHAAHKSFSAATASGSLWDSGYPRDIAKSFKSSAGQIARRIDLPAINAELAMPGPSLGRGLKEQAYRRWALRRRLFINPLNDLGSSPVAACDNLLLPPLLVALSEKGVPPVLGLYNQLKQEFAFARMLLFEGSTSDGVHFADRRVRLNNTLDYPSFSIATEKVRTSFRLAYSILDKVGFFINRYWSLGAKEYQVGFRTVWYQGEDLHPSFQGYANWPLLGLFWLSKDLFDDKFQRVTDPDAREIFIIRNHLEHKYLQVHEGWAWPMIKDPVTGNLGHSISSDDFEAKALRTLKVARAALIYLPLAVNVEEQSKRRAKGAEMSIEMPLLAYDDAWKR